MTGPEGAGRVSHDGHRPARVSAVRRKPSITDVARIAGVSYQTVSRVITGTRSSHRPLKGLGFCSAHRQRARATECLTETPVAVPLGPSPTKTGS